MAGLSSLALLDLSRNQLGTISREALQPLASLQVLRLTGTSFWGKGVSCKVVFFGHSGVSREQAQVWRGLPWQCF